MKEVKDIQELLRKQKSYMNAILLMTEKLFGVQAQLAELMAKEIKTEIKVDNTPSDILSAKDVCSMLEISPSTLYRMRIQNGFPYIKEKGRKNIMFRKEDIDEYLINLKNKHND